MYTSLFVIFVYIVSHIRFSYATFYYDGGDTSRYVQRDPYYRFRYDPYRYYRPYSTSSSSISYPTLSSTDSGTVSSQTYTYSPYASRPSTTNSYNYPSNTYATPGATYNYSPNNYNGGRYGQSSTTSTGGNLNYRTYPATTSYYGSGSATSGQYPYYNSYRYYSYKYPSTSETTTRTMRHRDPFSMMDSPMGNEILAPFPSMTNPTTVNGSNDDTSASTTSVDKERTSYDDVPRFLGRGDFEVNNNKAILSCSLVSRDYELSSPIEWVRITGPYDFTAIGDLPYVCTTTGCVYEFVAPNSTRHKVLADQQLSFLIINDPRPDDQGYYRCSASETSIIDGHNMTFYQMLKMEL